MPRMPPTFLPPGRKPRAEEERDRKAALDARRPTPAARGYDVAWRKVRAQFIAAHPTCSRCGCPTEEVHHIRSVVERPDLRLSWSNLLPLCKPHHSAITARMQSFGRDPDAAQGTGGIHV